MKRNTLTQNERALIFNAVVSRAMLAAQLGKSYGGDRDLYTALGYPVNITFEQYFARYKRQDIAKRVVNAFPDACWAKPPDIQEADGESDTPFEKAWKKLLRKMPVWHYLKRADQMSGVGQYGVLLMGFDDGKAPEQPVVKAKNLLYLRPFYESAARIVSWETDKSSERYGLPKTYSLSIAQPNTTGGELSETQYTVHHSRIIHFADGLMCDDIYGTPRLEAVYNRLQDLEMIAGGGAEMWWRGAFPGFGFTAMEGASFDLADTTALKTEIEDYIHGLKRYMKLQNIDIEQLAPQLADSTKPFDVAITLICIATGIPKRVLMGTERGELASSQDESAWDDKVEERRTNYCAPLIVRRFVDRLVEVGVLPTPADYDVYWSPLHIMNEKEKAEIARAWTEALTKYAGTPGTEFVMPPEQFLSEIMGFDDEKVRKILEDLKGSIAEELAEIKKYEAAMRAEETMAGGLKAGSGVRGDVTNE